MVTTAGNFIPSFQFGQGNVYYSASQVTFSGSAAISANAIITTANQVIMIKNLNFTPPKGEVEIVHLLGVEATTTGAGVPATGTFQNAIVDEKSFGMATLTGTLVFTAHNDGSNASYMLPDFINLITGTGQAISTTHHLHTFGDETATQVRVTAGAIVIVMKNSVQEATLCMNEPYGNFGDIKPTGDDGYYEMEVEFKCLPKNCVLEVKDQD